MKELLYFFGILVVLAFLQHPDLLLSPLTRLNLMLDKKNYFHPLMWSSSVYFLVGLVRIMIGGIRFLRSKSKK